MNKFTFLGIILFSCLSVKAQQTQYIIKGIVKDSLTNEPISGANVSLSYGTKTIQTNAKGEFKSTFASEVPTLSITYLGYITFRMKIQASDNDRYLVVKLLKKEFSLEELTVSSTSTGSSVKRPLLGVSSLSIKTINKLPTPFGEIDILKGLQMLPGVNSVGEASNGVNIRGGNNDQNLILLDNAPIFNPTHMFGLFSAFPSEGVSNFELYKGNIPAKFGGRSASVLDIALANPSIDKFKLTGGLSVVSEKLKLDIPLIKDKLGIMLVGRTSFNDFFLPIFSKKLADVKARFGDGTAKLFYKINNKQTFSLSSYISYDYFKTDLLGTINNINATSTQFKYNTKNFTATYFYEINRKSSLQIIGVRADYQPSILLPEFDSENVIKLNQRNTNKEIKVLYTYFHKNHIIETGVNVINYFNNSGELLPGASNTVTPQSNPIENGLENAVFINDEFDVNKKLTISAGLRYSYFLSLGASEVSYYKPGAERTLQNVISTESFSKNQIAKTYGGLEPRLGIRYLLNQSTSLKLGYNFSRQYFQQVSNTTTPLPTSRWKLADENIKPQKSQLITVGINKDFEGKIYQISTEAYFRKTENILDYKPGADFVLNKFPEREILQGINNSYGLEFMVSKQKGELSGWINYTYARSFNQINEGPAENQRINGGDFYRANYDRPHTLNASVIIGQGKHHDFSFNFTYSTGRPLTTPQGYVQYNNNIFPFYNIRNNSRIPDYHRLDFAWNIYNPKMNESSRFKGNWAFSVYNLYGAKNPYSVFFKSENRTLQPYKLIIFGAPIVSLSYKFTYE